MRKHPDADPDTTAERKFLALCREAAALEVLTARGVSPTVDGRLLVWCGKDGSRQVLEQTVLNLRAYFGDARAVVLLDPAKVEGLDVIEVAAAP